MIRLFATLLVALAGLLPVRSHGAPQATGFGSASFSDTAEASGCITTEVHVFASNGSIDRTESSGRVFLKVTRFNHCTETALTQILAEDTIKGTSFQVDAAGRKATLNGMMTVSDDLHPGSYPLTIHVEWTAASDPPVAHKTQSLFVGPGRVSRLPQPVSILSTDTQASLRLTVRNLLNLNLDKSEAAAIYQLQDQ
jgi:hypothetical protein